MWKKKRNYINLELYADEIMSLAKQKSLDRDDLLVMLDEVYNMGKRDFQKSSHYQQIVYEHANSHLHNPNEVDEGTNW
jgi:hypothetical protein